MKTFFKIWMVLMLLFGCALAEDADITGNWYAHTLKVQGLELSAEETGLAVSLTINEDGSAEYNLGGNVYNGAWTMEKEVLSFKAKPAVDLTFTVVDGELVSDGETTMIFGREIIVPIENGSSVVFIGEEEAMNIIESSPHAEVIYSSDDAHEHAHGPLSLDEFNPGNAVAAESLEAFEGSWDCIVTGSEISGLFPIDEASAVTLSFLEDQVLVSTLYPGEEERSGSMSGEMQDGSFLITQGELTGAICTLTDQGMLQMSLDVDEDVAYWYFLGSTDDSRD